MKRRLVAACMVWSWPLLAQVAQNKLSTPSKDGVESLLVNSTVSANGLDFFLSFVDFWREKPGFDKYNIEVAERSSRRQASQVWIAYGQRQLFASGLPNKRESIRALAEQAAETSYATLVALALPFSGAKDLDISPDEL